jgi:hypothetical protein
VRFGFVAEAAAGGLRFAFVAAGGLAVACVFGFAAARRPAAWRRLGFAGLRLPTITLTRIPPHP